MLVFESLGRYLFCPSQSTNNILSIIVNFKCQSGYAMTLRSRRCKFNCAVKYNNFQKKIIIINNNN